MALTPRQRATLKARAHALEPVVTVGQHGTSDALIKEVDRSLTAHAYPTPMQDDSESG